MFGWDEVELSVARLGFFPRFSFFVVKQVLFWWVIAFNMTR
jgi:hypothetical protein